MKYLKLVLGLLLAPVLIPYTLLSLVIIGIIEALTTRDWEMYSKYHFEFLLGLYRLN